ncbi:MAG TPA: acyl-CoA dehydrogenase family protein [Streptosporangiaceae bacterium]|nr:acyl-CoA dehydrogenase family protein [Streptosporangiaceae bacterium]
MDFELTQAQQVIATSAAEVLLAAEAGPSDAGPSDAGPSGAGAAWQALAKAGLLALTLPGWLGGDDLGVLDAAVLLAEVGRRAAAVPALATIMLGALPVARWGDKALQERVLAGVGAGEVILTAAVREQSAPFPRMPATVARAGTVSGTKVGVPYAAQASWLLIPAALASGGRAVVLVERAGTGVSLSPAPVSGTAPEYTVRLDAAPIAGMLGAGQHGASQHGAGAAVDDLYQLALAGAVAAGDGALAGALDLTAGYIARREQFGRPLATFQAVAQQIADVYVASRTLHLAALSACWRLGAGLDAAGDVDVAAYWLAEEAPAAMRTCHHLHGGIGLDAEYPLHRYSALITDLVRFTGGAGYRLDALTEQGGGNAD